MRGEPLGPTFQSDADDEMEEELAEMTPPRMDSAHEWRKPQRLALLLGAALGFCAISVATAQAGTRIPYAGEFREEIDETFFEAVPGGGDSGARVSVRKLAEYRALLEQKQRFLLAHVATSEQLVRGKSEKKAARSAKKTDLALALRLALEKLERLEGEHDIAAAYETAATMLMLEYATRSFTDPLASIKITTHLKNLLNEWSVPASTKASNVAAEAGNLVNSEDGSFYTREELAALVKRGSDLSDLHPPDETPFWRRKPDIAGVEILSNYLGGGDPVHEGLVAEFPPEDGAVVVLDKLRLTQSKPKMDVFYSDPQCLEQKRKKAKRCRQRVKLKFGMEVHADPPANALLAALGFNVDVSMPMQNVRVYLGDTTLAQVERQWTGYFDRQRLHIYYPLHSVLVPGEAGHGRDERGEYLVFREAVAELKAPEIERIGFFSFSHGMAINAREGRALGMFNAWIANADMKDDENNKLSLRQGADGEWRMYLIQQDLGHSFGYVLPEKADWYQWDLIDPNPISRAWGKLRGRIELTYLDLQNNGLEHSVTYADAKWMVRLIAQLTKSQLDAAVRLGRWPDSVARLYVEKLANRRNGMVRAFGLEKEFAMFPVERHLTTSDGAVVDGELIQSQWEGSRMRYGEHWSSLVEPVGRYLLDAGIWALQRGAGAIDRIDPGRIEIGSRFVINPDILIELDRQVTLNPEATALFDQYIVRDSVAIGADVGAGYYASVEGVWIKRFSMAYPASTRRDGLLGGNRVLSLFLPVDVRRGELPAQYVLLREDAFAAGVRVSSEDSGTLFNVFGGEAGINRVVRRRSVIDRRDEIPLVWVDQPEYWRLRARAFLKAEFLEIPFARAEIARGDLTGFAWRLDPQKLDVVGHDGLPIIDRFIRYDDPTEIGTIALREPTRVSSNFDSRMLNWSLFFIGASHEQRDETIVHSTPAGDTQRVELQAQQRHVSRWQFLDNGEDQELDVTGYNVADELAEVRREGATVVVSYRVDDLNTDSDEFAGYHALLTQVGALDSAAAREFDPTQWEVSGKPEGRWRHVVTHAEVHYRGEALERLLALREADYWPLLAAELGTSPARLERLVDEARRRDRKLGRRGMLEARLGERGSVLRSLRVFDLLARAREAGAERERLRLLVAAIERANFRYGHTFDASVVTALNAAIGFAELVERDEVFAKGSIGRVLDQEMNFPERRAVLGERGKPDRLRETKYHFFPTTGLDLYNMLDWMRVDAAVN